MCVKGHAMGGVMCVKGYHMGGVMCSWVIIWVGSCVCGSPILGRVPPLRGNKYISNSRRFFDVYVFVLNLNSLAKRILHVCVFRIRHKTKDCKKREVCVPNSKSMAIFHVCVCVLNS